MPINITGSWNLTGAITSSLGFNGTASYATNSLTASYALASAGGGGSTDTGSLLTTASAVSNVITFTKGNGSTFNVTVSTGSGGGGGLNPLSYNYTTKTLDVSDNATIFPYQGYFPITSIINTGSLISIGPNAFNSLTGSFDLPAVTYIGDDAFKNNKITGIFVNNAKVIGTNVFKGNTTLATASFSSLENIPSGSFTGCTAISGSNYNFGAFTGSIGDGAFQDNFNLVNTDFVSGSVSTIGSSSFENCTSLTRVTFPNAQLSGWNIFKNTTNLVSASITSTTDIPKFAFVHDVTGSLQYIDFGAFAGIIGEGSFSNQPLISNLSPISGAILLEQSPFLGCTSITSASFNSATSIGSYCFANCTSLSYISLTALSGSDAIGGGTTDQYVFNNVAISGSIYVPTFYETNDGGNPDGDLVYLRDTLGWTINYV